MVRLEATFFHLHFHSKRVSIPIWCDWKFDICAKDYRFSVVSIPIWCDWKDVFVAVRSLFGEFQFLYGAIGSAIISSSPAPTFAFQFLYGAIGSAPAWTGGDT